MENKALPRVILFFIDRLGLGARDQNNPLWTVEKIAPLNNFKDFAPPIFADGILTPTDPRLGIEGRPQSVSGQTTILTGINAARLLG